MKNRLYYFMFLSFVNAQIEYNHPELKWSTFETSHFKVHYHEETENTAREAATVAEVIYPRITEFYDFEPKEKTHLVLIDPDDYSNGAAYYYDNKIMIWASPLDFELRGSHRWLQNVITHEFAHIVSLQKSMKAGTRLPGAYLQIMNYEKENRPDVLYGYPNTIISYPIPGTSIPPWFAEGIAQYMYDDADWDIWDSHRDMVLRDRVINNNMLTFTEMNTFGKKGIGNESTYNSGFALATYISNEYGSNVIGEIIDELSKPYNFSIDKAFMNVLGISGSEVYQDFKSVLEARYNSLTEPLKILPVKGDIIQNKGTANLSPKWHPTKYAYVYLSNKENDFIGQTDLFFHDLESGVHKKIKSGVFSSPSWNLDGNKVYYSKKSKFPNKNGSRFYDIYSYDFQNDKEERLTKDLRAFSPVFISKDSSIAYLATYDGGQDVYLLDLKLNTSKKLTDFIDRPMISYLTYDSTTHKLYFDLTSHHFRDLYSLDLINNEIELFAGNKFYDERNISFNNSGFSIHSTDRSGIYNLYMINTLDSTSGYITNVTGGAFMPDISKNGKVLYSLYENGSYNIALLDEIFYIEEDYIGYGPNYYQNNKDIRDPIKDLYQAKSKPYEDQFPNMFLMPKLMFDYGTLKPGFYFSSNEIINRLSLFGGASLNKLNDLDLFFIFDFKRLYPTIFFETYYLTRNKTDNTFYNGVYRIKDDIKFRLVQFRTGLKIPIFGSELEMAISRQWYRAFIQEQVYTNEGILDPGAAYDYFRGWSLNSNWKIDMRKRTLDKTINPSNGFTLNANLDIEKNDFIDGLDFSDSGTLLESFKPNNLLRFQFAGSYHHRLPRMDLLTLSISTKIGWISNKNADSFFHFYMGGMPGLRGYPYYAIHGTKSGMVDLTIRAPLFREKHYKTKLMIFQNATIGAIYQFGDAWNNDFLLKKSFGIQLRLNGFSFYNFPTAIELEYHQPMNNFEMLINNNQIEPYTIEYGERGRGYVKILFDF